MFREFGLFWLTSFIFFQVFNLGVDSLLEEQKGNFNITSSSERASIRLNYFSIYHHSVRKVES